MLKQTKKTDLRLLLAKHLSRSFRFVLFLVALTGVFLYTRAGTPTQVKAATSSNLNFQARLLNNSGAIVADGSYNVEFKLYDAAAGGSALWTESRYDTNGATAGNDNRVVVKSGYLSVYLGSVTSFPAINWDQDLYITMNVGNTAQSSACGTPFTAPYASNACLPDGEMSPRLKLTAVPYAFAAGQLAKVNGANTSTLNLASPTAITTFTIQAASAGNYDICTTAATCTGYASGSGAAFIQGGNTVAANTNLGLNSNFNLNILTNSLTRLTVEADGDLAVDTNTLFVDAAGNEVGIGTITPGTALDVVGTIRVASAAGSAFGTLTFGDNSSTRYIRGNSAELQLGSTLTELRFESTGMAQISSSAADGTTVVRINARTSHTAGNLLEVSNAGALRASIDFSGALVAVGINSGTGLIQGTGGLTLTGATSINTTGTANTTIGGTGGGTITLGAATGSDLVLNDANWSVTGAGLITTSNDIALNGGDLTTSSTTATLFNTNATTLNIGGEATTTSLGAATGTTTINNNLTVNGSTTIGNATTDRLTVTSQILGAGALVFQGATDDTFTTTFGITDPTANQTYRLPNSVAGTYDICTSANNCTSLGAYINNTVTVQTNANISIQSAGDSSITQLIRARAAQTADLLQFQNSGGTQALSGINSAGSIYFRDATSGFTSTLSVTAGSLSGSNKIVTLPNAGGEICTSSGNCVGNGGSGDVFKNGQTGPLVLGTNDAGGSNLSFITQNITRATFDYSNNLYLGNGEVNVAPNNFAIQGTGSSTIGTAGALLTMKGGAGATSGTGSAGGGLTLQGGDAGGSGINNGGSVLINGGAKTSTGTVGNVILQGTNGGYVGIGTSGTPSSLFSVGGTTGNLTVDASGNLGTSGTITVTNATTDITTGTNQDLTVVANGTGIINLNDDVSVGGTLAVTGNTVLGANSFLRLTGGTTANRPASPAEGMLFYDTDTKQLLVYSNGAWTNQSRSSTKVVAASNSQTPAGADYIADGEAVAGAGTIDGDQVQINQAITALPSGGGTVYLMEGTYTIDASISIPSNVTLAGAGASTLIQLTTTGAAGTALTAIVNSDTTNGNSRITLRDFRMDGNKANNSSGTQIGISFTKVGSGNGATAVPGAKITNLFIADFRNSGMNLVTSNNNTITSNNVQGSATSQGIRLESSSYNTVTGNVTQGNAGNGVVLVTATYNTVTGNTSQGNTLDGVQVDASSINTITGNIIHSNARYGLYVNASNNNTITSNTVSANSSSGIILNTGSSGNTISSNTAYQNSLVGIGLVNASNNNTITGNTASLNGRHGIALEITSDSNVVSGNKLHDNGSTAAYSGIYVSNSDRNTITGNDITDTAGTSYAIDIFNSTSDTNYLADNRYSGTGATTINDAGTGTIYGGQLDGSNNFLINPAANIELQSNTNVTGDLDVSGALNVGTGNALTVDASGNLGTSGTLTVTNGTLDLTTGTNQDLTVEANGTGQIILNDTVQVATLGTASNDTVLCRNGTNQLASCNSTFATTTQLQGYVQFTPASAQSDASANASVYINDTGGGNLIQLQSGAADKFVVANNGNTTVGGTLDVTGNTVLGANSTLRITGGTTAGRPVTPAEGTIYFDTDTKQLLAYGNAAWQNMSRSSTKVVAASNSQTPAGADYQVTAAEETAGNADSKINAAITALPAGGGTVYLMEGTYTIDTAISIPSNVTLAGAGASTIIKLKNGINANFKAIQNSDPTNGNTSITLRDFKLDGNKANNTSGIQSGIEFTKVGSGTGINANPGLTASSLTIANFRSIGLYLVDSMNARITGNSFIANNSIGITVEGFTVAEQYHLIINNHIKGNGDTAGIYITYAERLVITNNSIEGDSTGSSSGKGIWSEGSNYSQISDNNVINSQNSGITIQDTDYALVSGNKVHNSGTASGGTDAIMLNGDSDSNTITGNDITDTAGTGYAINIAAGTENANYLADNRYSGTGASSINDAGTGTIYGGQLDGSNNFLINPSANIELQSNTNVTGDLDVSGTLNVGTSNAFSVSSGGTLTFTGVATDITTGTNQDLTVEANGNGVIDLNDIVRVGVLAATDTDAYTLCRDASSGQLAACDANTTGKPFLQGGNTFGAAADLGTNDAFGVNIRTGGTTKLTVTAAGDLTFAQGANRTLNVAQAASGAGNNMTIAAGQGAAANGAGGVLVLTGGAGGGTNQNGGNVTIDGGAATGTGTKGHVVLQTGSGNVGIGTATPTATLQVAGNALFNNQTNSTTAFQVQNKDGGQPLLIDTTNSNATLGLNNPSFETGTTGWTARAGCTLTQDTTTRVFGLASGKCTNTATIGAGMNYPITLVNGTQYTFSIYMKGTNGASALDMGYAYNGSNETTYYRNAVYIGSGWYRVYTTFTPTGITGTPYLFIKQIDATARTFNIDAVQIEAAENENHYSDGSLQLGVINSTLRITPTDGQDALVVAPINGAHVPTFTVNTINQAVGINTGSLFNNFQIGDAATTDYLATASINSFGTKKNLVLQAGAAQTGNIFEAQNSSGTPLAVITSSGNVGIGTGTTAPLAQLNVQTGTTGNFGAGTTNSGILVSDTPGGDDERVTGLTIAAGGRSAASSLGWQFNLLGTNVYYDSATDTLKRFASAGGFGSTSAITMTADNNQAGGNRVSIWTGAGDPSERLVVTSGGNVGIGTTAPSAMLHVAGNQPAAVSGAGTAATSVFIATGGQGGNTTSIASQAAGAGAAFTVTTGNGGNATGATGANTSGVGGAISLTAGNGGVVTSATGIAGIGGGITLQAGTGGTGGSSGGNGGVLTFKGGTAGTSTNGNGGNVVLQGGVKQGTGTEGSVIVKPQNDNGSAFLIQLSGSTTNLFAADTSNKLIKIGTGTPSVLSATTGGLYVTNSIELGTNGVLRIGDGTNGIDFTAGTAPSNSNPFFKGTSRPTKRISLIPEYAGAVMTGTGTGTMTSDFCSNTNPAINTSVCGAAGSRHNYYSWTSTTGTNSYDIYVRHQLPSDFDGFAASDTVNMWGWRTDGADGTPNVVQLTLYQADGTQCGTTTNVATGTAAWSEVPLGGDETSCSFAANDTVLFKVTVLTNGTDFVRAGAIRFDYRSKF